DGIRDFHVTGVQTCALPILPNGEPAERHSSDDEPFAALAFKIATDPFVGTLTFIRVYSGVVTSGDSVLNAVKGRKERVGRLLQKIGRASCGDRVSISRAGVL